MVVDEEEDKRTNDFTAEVKRSIPEWTEPVRKNPSPEALQVALQKLLGLEKRTRLAADVDSTMKLAAAILDLCHEVNEWTILGDQITLLCKRRAQIPKVVQFVIQTAYKFVDSAPDDATKRAFLTTLRAVSDGKIFVELERARMTRTLAEMEEKDGKIAEAAAMLQELQIETIGAMEIGEKAELLLEQIRLCLATKDFVRAEIIMNKVKPAALAEEKLQPLKLKHYNLCIGFFMNSNRYLETCRAYIHIYNTPVIQADDAKWKEVLSKSVLLAVMSPFDSELSDILSRLSAEKKLESLPHSRNLLKQFTTDELMSWPPANHETFRQDSIFADMEKGEDRWQDLRKRVVQHNLRVFSQYYTQVTTFRCAELLGLDEKTLEKRLSEMVSSKQLYARIDRPAGIISFERKQSSNEVLNSWAGDIDSLLTLVNSTCHLIDKENMSHKITT